MYWQMLNVIDGVKLASIDHVLNVRYFDHRHAVFFQQIVNAAHEAVEIWHVGQDIAGVNHVGLITLRSQTSAQFVAKEFTDRRNAVFFTSNSRNVRGRLYS